ncbi:MAG: 4-hydroxy-tetrahydrodipicolinate synthase [Candidatus Omnitrophica bacterium 4484_213]|nr:MAG: 4-hydroxy-tetrahydrodipicolinate synthase [Candidatus Omnitrophica bacterium 4484_213]
MFQGSYVALVTPFKDGAVDDEKLRELVESQIKQGTNGILPCGCTGEAATLTHEEQKRIIKIVVETVNKRVPVLAGTGSNSTAEAYDLTKYAKEAGANAALVITPYYNKPTSEGQFRHYAKLAELGIPIILYNVPSRTGISMLPETVARLSKIDNIVAIKEASGSLEQVSKILALCDITVLSGDDSLTLPMMAIGGKGVVSVVANIVPAEVAQMTSAFLEGNIQKAKDLHYKLFPLCKAMFIETNPIPVKTAMKLLGQLNGELRLPL